MRISVLYFLHLQTFLDVLTQQGKIQIALYLLLQYIYSLGVLGFVYKKSLVSKGAWIEAETMKLSSKRKTSLEVKWISPDLYTDKL